MSSNDSPASRLLLTLAAALPVLCTYLLFPNSNAWIDVGIVAVMAVLIFVYRLSYLSHGTAYALPWLMILLFSNIPISQYHQPLNPGTYALVFGSMLAWLVSASLSPVAIVPVSSQRALTVPEVSVANFRKLLGFLIFGLVLEILVSGFIPIVSLFTTGDSQYFGFGIPSLHGAFLAYANAFACLAYYIYLVKGGRWYLAAYFLVVGIFLALVTRQNLVTLLVETLVLWCFVRQSLSRSTVVIAIAAALTAFSIFGELRTGDISELLKVAPEYSRVPQSLLWLYAYSYFNVLNLQNMLVNSGAPYFDGSMFNGLLPSAIRGITDQESYVVYSQLNVTSYMDPVYRDIGFGGTILLTAVFGAATSFAMKRAAERRTFVSVAMYGCLYYCALFSFFVNNWFYLPVICQPFFIWIFAKLVLGQKPVLQNY